MEKVKFTKVAWRLYLIGLLVLSDVLAIGQDWKSHYDKAIQSYQSQQYAEALTHAEQAYALSKNLEVKNQAFSLQLLSAICLEIPDYTKGLSYSADEIKLFAQSGTQTKQYAEAVKKKALLLQGSGKLPEACKTYAEVEKLYSEVFGPASLEFNTLLSNYGQALLAQNKFAEASPVLHRSVEGLKSIPDAKEDYLFAIYYASVADVKAGNSTAAEAGFNDFVKQVESNGLQSWTEYPQAKSQLVALAKLRGDKGTVLQQGDENQKAQVYLATGIDFQNKSLPEEALKNYALGEQSLAKSGMENNVGFSILLNSSQALLDLNRIDEAKSKLQKARQVAVKLFAPTGSEMGFLANLEAHVLLVTGHAPEADAKYAEAFRLMATLPLASLARYKTNAASGLLNANRPDLARHAVEDIAQNNQQVYSLPEINQVGISTVYCEALLELNLPDIAISYLSRSIANAKTPALQDAFRIKLAQAYKSTGDWKKSATLLGEVLKHSGILPEHRAEAALELARLQQLMGRYTESENNYLEAIGLYEQLHSPEVKLAYNAFATFYLTLGNYPAAELIYMDLLSDPKTSPGIASAAKQNLAAMYQQTLRYDDAERMLKEVLETDKKTIGENSPAYAIALQNLASVYKEKGDYEKAKVYYRQALAIDKANFGDQSLDYAVKIANLGAVYTETREFAEARSAYEQALKIKERILGKDNPDFVFTHYTLAALYERTGEYAAAASLFREVSAFYLKEIRETFPALSEYEKTAFYNKISNIISDYQRFVILHGNNDPVLVGDLYDFRLQTKALLLNATTKVRNTILSSGNQELLSRFTEWLQLKEKLTRYSSLTLDEKRGLQKTIEQSQQKANELEKWLSTQSELFGNEYSSQIIHWQDVRKALKPGEAAVEMIRLNPEQDSVTYAALILKPNSTAPQLLLFPYGSKMETRWFSYYINTIRFTMENKSSYQIYWQPLEPFLKDVTTVYFSADGVYNKINSLTLFDPQKGEYLMDRMVIRLLSNIKEVVKRSEYHYANSTASLIGYPDFNPTTTAAKDSVLTGSQAVIEIKKHGVADLPGTREEIVSIGQLLEGNNWKVKTLLQKDASEDNIKKMVSPVILHIATHGFFIPQKAKETPAVYSTDLTLSNENPLTRSGLILSEIGIRDNKNHMAEDGILTALEVMNLTLDHTDLVVLSACETGSGEVRNGEGVYGLQRAFLVAGATSLMMSLWKVSDQVTQELMVEFYKQLVVLKDQQNAFTQAQLVIKKKYKEPFYWGAFVLIGH